MLYATIYNLFTMILFNEICYSAVTPSEKKGTLAYRAEVRFARECFGLELLPLYSVQ